MHHGSTPHQCLPGIDYNTITLVLRPRRGPVRLTEMCADKHAQATEDRNPLVPRGIVSCLTEYLDLLVAFIANTESILLLWSQN